MEERRSEIAGVYVALPSESTGEVTETPSRRKVFDPPESDIPTLVSSPLYVNEFVDWFGYVIPVTLDS